MQAGLIVRWRKVIVEPTMTELSTCIVRLWKSLFQEHCKLREKLVGRINTSLQLNRDCGNNNDNDDEDDDGDEEKFPNGYALVFESN